MIPGSDGFFWDAVRGLVNDDGMHYIGDGSPRRAMPKGAPVFGKPGKGASVKALTWDHIRAMNEAYLRDIEQKNIYIKPDETIEELLKEVKTYKKGRYSARYRDAKHKNKADKEVKVDKSRGTGFDLTLKEQLI